MDIVYDLLETGIYGILGIDLHSTQSHFHR